MEKPTVKSAIQLLKQILPETYLDSLEDLHGANRVCLYSPFIVIWLMIFQRLGKGSTFEEAVKEMLEGETVNELPDCKKVRSGKISSKTGAYSIARKRLPLELVEEVQDHIFDTLCERALKKGERRIFTADGTTLSLESTKELKKAFPPGEGSPWPILNVAVAHDAYSGVATRPEWGPMYGENAINETKLARKLFERMPAESIILGDRAYGIFSIVNAAILNSHDVVMRLKDDRAAKISGELLERNSVQEVEWSPSRWDLKSNSELTGAERIKGRVITRKLKEVKENGEPEYLRLFTTLTNVPANDVVELYGMRWDIETDLRDFKQTMKVNSMRSKTPEMVVKELYLAIIAYNIVNEVRREIAIRAGLHPRDCSFTRVMRQVYSDGLRVVQGSELTPRQKLFREVQGRNIFYFSLPKRKKPRSYPRKVYRRCQSFPYRRGYSCE